MMMSPVLIRREPDPSITTKDRDDDGKGSDLQLTTVKTLRRTFMDKNNNWKQ